MLVASRLPHMAPAVETTFHMLNYNWIADSMLIQLP